MSTEIKRIHTSEEVVEYYTNRMHTYGATAVGVGWKDEHAQMVRFQQLVKVIGNPEGFTINDVGCGIAALYNYLLTQSYKPATYYGYDVLDSMLEEAARRLPVPEVKLTKINDAREIATADYSMASGIFNLKYGFSDDEMRSHVISTITEMNTHSRLGFGFNLLTGYSDKEYMQPHLYYADPLFFFDYCKRNFSRNVALLHDYDQYDFTILVRKKTI